MNIFQNWYHAENVVLKPSPKLIKRIFPKKICKKMFLFLHEDFIIASQFILQLLDIQIVSKFLL